MLTATIPGNKFSNTFFEVFTSSNYLFFICFPCNLDILMYKYLWIKKQVSNIAATAVCLLLMLLESILKWETPVSISHLWESETCGNGMKTWTCDLMLCTFCTLIGTLLCIVASSFCHCCVISFCVLRHLWINKLIKVGIVVVDIDGTWKMSRDC